MFSYNGTSPKKIKTQKQDLRRGHKKQKYRSAWEEVPEFKEWLAPVAGNNLMARCTVCDKQFLSEISVIKKHKNSKKHIKNLTAELCNRSKQIKLNESQNDDPFVKQVKVAEIRTCAFLVEQNLSFRCVDQLIKRDKAIYPDSEIAQKVALGRTKATNIVKYVISKAHGDELAERLKKQKFSILIDESTDIGSIKSLAVCVRLFSEETETVEDCFWKLVQVFSSDDTEAENEGATAERLFQEVINTFDEAAVPLENMIGFAADNCNTMLWSHNSVASRFKQLLPGITIQGYVCHSLHLCASEACKTLPRKPEDLARQIYGYFKNSSKRQAQFKEFQDFCELKPHKILKPSQTRWLSSLEVVQKILEKWEALKLFFNFHQQDALSSSSTVGDKTTSLDFIVDAMNDPQVKIYFLFLQWILPKFITINKLFQSEKSAITSIHNKISLSYKDILSSYMNKEYILKVKLADIDPEPKKTNPAQAKFLNLSNIYLGIGVMQEFKKEEVLKHKSLEAEVRSRCRNFMVKACQELKNRFDLSSDSPFSKISVLHPKEVLSKTSTRCESLFPLAATLPRIISPREIGKLQKIDDQWRRISIYDFDELKQSDTPEKVWLGIKKFTDKNGQNEFADVAAFAMDALCLPHSSAGCERVFSKINLVKTKIRNKLATETINGLLLTSQCATRGGGSQAFPISEKMISLMNNRTLYPSKAKENEVDPEENEVEFDI